MLLEGVTVVEVAVFGQGPLVGAMLADLGARVIKIEQPDGDPSRRVTHLWGVNQELRQDDGGMSSTCYEIYNRGKLGVGLDLKTPGGAEVLARLVKDADVFIQNFVPRTAARLGVEFERIAHINPSIVYLESSGFGSKGPWKDAPAFDSALLAFSGMMFAGASDPASPQPLVGALGDSAAGSMGAMAVLAGLVSRARGNTEPLHLEASQLGSLVWLQNLHFATMSILGRGYDPLPRTSAVNPLYTIYECRDAEWISLTEIEPTEAWGAVCAVLGRPDLILDDRAQSLDLMITHQTDLIAELDKAFITMAREDVLALLREAGMKCAPIQRVREVIEHEQVTANGYMQTVQDADWKLPAVPIKTNGQPVPPFTRAPQLGEHTDRVLADLGFSEEERALLRESGVLK